jgi:hypothetical protein
MVPPRLMAATSGFTRLGSSGGNSRFPQSPLHWSALKRRRSLRDGAYRGRTGDLRLAKPRTRSGRRGTGEPRKGCKAAWLQGSRRAGSHRRAVRRELVRRRFGRFADAEFRQPRQLNEKLEDAAQLGRDLVGNEDEPDSLGGEVRLHRHLVGVGIGNAEPLQPHLLLDALPLALRLEPRP